MQSSNQNFSRYKVVSGGVIHWILTTLWSWIASEAFLVFFGLIFEPGNPKDRKFFSPKGEGSMCQILKRWGLLDDLGGSTNNMETSTLRGCDLRANYTYNHIHKWMHGIPPFVAFPNEWFHAVCKVERLSVQSPLLQKDPEKTQILQSMFTYQLAQICNFYL